MFGCWCFVLAISLLRIRRKHRQIQTSKTWLLNAQPIIQDLIDRSRFICLLNFSGLQTEFKGNIESVRKICLTFTLSSRAKYCWNRDRWWRKILTPVSSYRSAAMDINSTFGWLSLTAKTFIEKLLFWSGWYWPIWYFQVVRPNCIMQGKVLLLWNYWRVVEVYY